MKFKISIFIFSIIFISFGYGQESYFAVQEIKKGESLSFPVFSNPKDSLSAEKINQFLQISELQTLKGKEKKHIFENICENIADIEFGYLEENISCNSQKNVSIYFTKPTFSFNSNFYYNYYNFNSKNGDLIQLEDLFSKKGFEFFKTIVKTKSIEKYKIESNKIDTATRVDLSLNSVISYIGIDNLFDFYIINDTIFIEGENLLTKSQKILEMDMTTKYSLSEFNDYLNDYGKALFSLSNDSIGKFRSKSFPQLFEGTIDNQKILMILDKDEKNKVSAKYVYQKFGQVIGIYGDINDSTLSMTESDDKGNSRGIIEAQFDGENIIGTWSNKDKSKSYKFIAKRK